MLQDVGGSQYERRTDEMWDHALLQETRLRARARVVGAEHPEERDVPATRKVRPRRLMSRFQGRAGEWAGGVLFGFCSGGWGDADGDALSAGMRNRENRCHRSDQIHHMPVIFEEHGHEDILRGARTFRCDSRNFARPTSSLLARPIAKVRLHRQRPRRALFRVLVREQPERRVERLLHLRLRALHRRPSIAFFSTCAREWLFEALHKSRPVCYHVANNWPASYWRRNSNAGLHPLTAFDNAGHEVEGVRGRVVSVHVKLNAQSLIL